MRVYLHGQTSRATDLLEYIKNTRQEVVTDPKDAELLFVLHDERKDSVFKERSRKRRTIVLTKGNPPWSHELDADIRKAGFGICAGWPKEVEEFQDLLDWASGKQQK